MQFDLSYLDARALLLTKVKALSPIAMPLRQAIGRTLAEPLMAAENIPPFDRSPYDGYAFRAADTATASPQNPVTLRILEEVAAGYTPTHSIETGTATKILTGAPIPKGADTVCPYEQTEFTETEVRLFRAYTAGKNIVRAGEDVKKGEVLAEAGAVIDAGLAAALAAQGMWQPRVYPMLRVGILSTGSELLPDGAPLAAGKIPNTNHVMLAAAVQQAGFAPVYLGTVPDDTEAIAAAFNAGLSDCDAILSTGGVSAGDYDLVPPALQSIGATMLLQRVRLKPGMACAYALKEKKLLCGLSGNPASALTNFYAVALPALRKLAGMQPAEPPLFEVRLLQGFDKKSPSGRLLRGRLCLKDGIAYIDIPQKQGNVVVSSAIGCDMMAIVPEGSDALAKDTLLKGFML